MVPAYPKQTKPVGPLNEWEEVAFRAGDRILHPTAGIITSV